MSLWVKFIAEKNMVIVYVKHYLTKEGINFFENEWFPNVRAIINKQSGFIEINYQRDKVHPDCLNISLLFSDQKKLDDWIAHPSHDDLIKSLDRYRSRGYWEAVCTEDEYAESTELKWERILLPLE